MQPFLKEAVKRSSIARKLYLKGQPVDALILMRRTRAYIIRFAPDSEDRIGAMAAVNKIIRRIEGEICS